MKIALAQMEVIPGMPKQNLETMLSMIEQAKQQEVDLIAFPEMSVPGYLLGDMWLNENFCKDLMTYNQTLLKASNGIAVAYGNIFLDKEIEKRVGKGFHPNKDGRIRKYNAVYVFQNQKPVKRLEETPILPEGVQPKTLLPNYRFFDDQRYFFSLEDVAKDFNVELETLTQPFLIETKGKDVAVGFELCEDLWCEDYRKRGISINPTKTLIKNKAEYIVNISASPWTCGKNSARDKRIRFIKQESNSNFVPFFYVNCTGAQNNGKNVVTFDGGSTVYNKEGLPIIFSKEAYQEELMIIKDKDLQLKPSKRLERPKIEQKYKAIIKGIRHLGNISGGEQPRFIIGLSGGIDSTVNAALLAIAVGPEKILGVNMPSEYNSEKTKEAAAYVARKLRISYGIIPINNIVKENQKAIDSVDFMNDKKKLSEFNMENIQAKIRGTSILSNLAAKYNALLTNNGNKLEVALGYATLYGDWNGAIAPIADLTKTEVVNLAKYLNKEVFKDEVISNKLIPDKLWRFKDNQIQPTAELKNNQIDPMKFGYHCALVEAMTDYKKKSTEDVMQWYLKGTLEKNLNISTDLLKRWNLTNPQEFIRDLEWFNNRIRFSVFKRVQAPPIIITSKSAYGFDIRESILPYEPTKRHEQLKRQVLRLKKYTSNNLKLGNETI